MAREATLTLGLPHTNRWGLAEHLLMQHTGHLQWSSIAEVIGTPLSRLRTADGREVYATFYFVELSFPDESPIDSFRLDDTLRFQIEQRAFKGMAVEGRIVFDRDDRLAAQVPHPSVRFGNIFITPYDGNRQLRVAAPANTDFSRLPVLPNDENPYQLTRDAAASGRLGVIDERWRPLDSGVDASYAIDPDRDTNGAGLVYFANYFAFMNAAERTAAAASTASAIREADARLVRTRRTAFYGNVDVDGALRTTVSFFQDPAAPTLVAARYAIRRADDGALICLSEAIKRCARD